MDFHNLLDQLNLDDEQKEQLVAILEVDALNALEKLEAISDSRNEGLDIDDDVYDRIKIFLQGNEEEEEEEEVSTDFMALIEKKKQIVARAFVKKGNFSELHKLVEEQNNAECLRRFEEYMRQEGHTLPVQQSNPPTRQSTMVASSSGRSVTSSRLQRRESPVYDQIYDDFRQQIPKSFPVKQTPSVVTQQWSKMEKSIGPLKKNRYSYQQDPDDTTSTVDTSVFDSDEDEPPQQLSEPANNSIPSWHPNISPEFFKKFPKCLNILILGETGVGKSTFINGLANYLKYSNMHEAKAQGVEILIRSSFTHMDEHSIPMTIDCDPTIATDDDDEHVITGESSTQSPKTYQFGWGPPGNQKRICIIDTPGVGDTRGPEQENMNFAKILSFIADYPEIHAILILLKPNVARLTPTYRYCINELLTHLHVSASQNIIFCYTNTRGTMYGPGETLVTLTAHLDKLYRDRGIRIPLNNNTQFFFDNESFRFLCAWRQGVKFEEDEVEDFNKSWKKTVEETFRLFKRISELQPHNTEDTLSVNNIRQVVLAMARPLAEISKNLTTNAQLIEEKVKEVDMLMQQGRTLNTANLYVDQVVMTQRELPYPITVCTAECCIKMVKLSGNVTEQYYKQQCHPGCSLKGIQTGVIPNPLIKKCACFEGNPDKCAMCGCDWQTHLHIRYDLVKSVQKVLDSTVKNSVDNCDSQLKTAQIFIQSEKKRKAELENEANIISNHCAEFAAFLKKNSIIPYNDAYKEYVEHLIKQEISKISNGGSKNRNTLVQLQKSRDEYAEKVKILESHGKNKSTSTKSVKEIYDMLNELKRMKDCGKLLIEIEKLEMLSVRQERANRIIDVNIQQGWMNRQYSNVSSSFGRLI